jgi:hypothetical protein
MKYARLDKDDNIVEVRHFKVPPDTEIAHKGIRWTPYVEEAPVIEPPKEPTKEERIVQINQFRTSLCLPLITEEDFDNYVASS